MALCHGGVCLVILLKDFISCIRTLPPVSSTKWMGSYTTPPGQPGKGGDVRIITYFISHRIHVWYSCLLLPYVDPMGMILFYLIDEPYMDNVYSFCGLLGGHELMVVEDSSRGKHGFFFDGS